MNDSKLLRSAGFAILYLLNNFGKTHNIVPSQRSYKFMSKQQLAKCFIQMNNIKLRLIPAYVMFTLCAFLFLSCDERIKGFSRPKYDYQGSLEPKILESYPQEIDSIIHGYFDKKGYTDSMKIMVFFPVVITGDKTGYIDTAEYNASVLIMKKESEVWSFNFQRNKSKIDRYFVHRM